MNKTVITTAGNALAPALAVLRELGYSVSAVPGNPTLLQADNELYHLVAEDPLQLLGLAALATHRGAAWTSTDAEVSALLALENNNGAK